MRTVLKRTFKTVCADLPRLALTVLSIASIYALKTALCPGSGS